VVEVPGAVADLDNLDDEANTKEIFLDAVVKVQIERERFTSKSPHFFVRTLQPR